MSTGGEKMRDYELVYILKTDTTDERKEEIDTRIQGIITKDGEVSEVDVWGNRKLAYKIQKLSDGYYVLIKFKAGSNVPKELDRNLKIMEEVLRHMIIKVSDK